MAFVQVGSWHAASAPGGPSWSPGARTRRGGAILFTGLVHAALLWALVNHLSGTWADPPREEALKMFNVLPPGSAEDTKAAASAPRVAPPAAPALAEVDLSTPTELPPEWSMTQMRVARALPSETLAAGNAVEGTESGSGGPPRLKQFVGFGDGIGGELLLDKALLESARQAAIRSVAEAKGTALVFLRVSPAGTVTGAVIKGGGRDVGLALRRELVGKKLFVVRSRISESALVALPPVSLSRT